MHSAINGTVEGEIETSHEPPPRGRLGNPRVEAQTTISSSMFLAIDLNGEAAYVRLTVGHNFSRLFELVYSKQDRSNSCAILRA